MGRRTLLTLGLIAPLVAGRGVPRVSANAVGRNVNITNKSGAQSETTIAIDPLDPNHMMAASNDLSGFRAFNNVLESFDRGRTWQGAGITVDAFCYDPWLTFDAAGDTFFAYECSDERIAYRKHGQTTWTYTTLQDSSLTPDRDMVTTDRSSASPFLGSVYVGYDDANFNGNDAHVWYSRTGFGGWTKSPKINDVSSSIGVNAATAPEGTVHATWHDFNGRKLWVDRSTNGGATWSTDHLVTRLRLNTINLFISIPPQPHRGIALFPFTMVAPAGTPFASRLYVTYTDRDPAASDTNVYVRYSDDGGLSWSAATKVNDDPGGAYQFHPRIAVSPTGTVAVAFYDTRDDNQADHKTNTYISYSADGGTTWSADGRVTSAQSDESGAGDPNDYGDHQGIDASSANWFQVVWTDSRVGAKNEDMFAAIAKM
jgi:hypothetical protein